MRVITIPALWSSHLHVPQQKTSNINTIYKRTRFLSGVNTTCSTFQAMEVEWLVGCTTEQMSYRKALEVLGVTQAMLEEERSKILGGLGVRTCNTSPAVFTSMVGANWNTGTCEPLFRKHRHEAPVTTPIHRTTTSLTEVKRLPYKSNTSYFRG